MSLRPAFPDVPSVIQYQGRIQKGGISFAGTGQFKFALVNADASETFWRNAPDDNGDGQPDHSVAVPVVKGLYSVLLGSSALPNMQPLPPGVFTNSSVHLRVWFGDGSGPNELLAPDQRIAAVGYAMMAAAVSAGSVTLEQLAPDVLQSLTAVSFESADPSLMGRGFIPFYTTQAAMWASGTVSGSLLPRYGNSAVWTGSALIIWGGDLGGGAVSGAGASYSPSSDQWEALPSQGSPAPRNNHSAVWTGTQMIVWGGFASGQYLNTGGRYDPVSHQWNLISLANAPTGRLGPVAVRTGVRLLIWGGRNATGVLGDGALYDPASDQWSSLSVPGAPDARHNGEAVWAKDRIILWGGTGTGGTLGSGAQLLFNGSTPSVWTAVNPAGAPSARSSHSMVWTGEKAIVWGGESSGSLLGDGAAYDPVADAWQTVPVAQAPSARSDHSAVWTGGEMVIFAGRSVNGEVSTGAAYGPSGNRWRPLTNAGAPLARSGATTAWTGTEILVFGGVAGGAPVASLQRLNPQPAWTFYRKP